MSLWDIWFVTDKSQWHDFDVFPWTRLAGLKTIDGQPVDAWCQRRRINGQWQYRKLPPDQIEDTTLTNAL